MAVYQRILVALDFSPVAEKVMTRARQLAEWSQAQTLLLHVVEYLPPVDPSGDLLVAPMWDVDEVALVDAARRKLGRLADTQGFPGVQRDVLVGNAKREIPEYARQQQCDLIVIGSHGRYGISRLLGSTASGVLHRARCDVLAVRAEP